MKTKLLQEVQTKLNNRGLKDVKLFFSLNVSSKANTNVLKEVAYVLNTYERGDFVAMEPFGDSTLLN